MPQYHTPSVPHMQQYHTPSVPHMPQYHTLAQNRTCRSTIHSSQGRDRQGDREGMGRLVGQRWVGVG
eukprot:3940665-Rhodomonas_salina.1